MDYPGKVESIIGLYRDQALHLPRIPQIIAVSKDSFENFTILWKSVLKSKDSQMALTTTHETEKTSN